MSDFDCIIYCITIFNNIFHDTQSTVLQYYISIILIIYWYM